MVFANQRKRVGLIVSFSSYPNIYYTRTFWLDPGIVVVMKGAWKDTSIIMRCANGSEGTKNLLHIKNLCENGLGKVIRSLGNAASQVWNLVLFELHAFPGISDRLTPNAGDGDGELWEPGEFFRNNSEKFFRLDSTRCGGARRYYHY